LFFSFLFFFFFFFLLGFFGKSRDQEMSLDAIAVEHPAGAEAGSVSNPRTIGGLGFASALGEAVLKRHALRKRFPTETDRAPARIQLAITRRG